MLEDMEPYMSKAFFNEAQHDIVENVERNLKLGPNPQSVTVLSHNIVMRGGPKNRRGDEDLKVPADGASLFSALLITCSTLFPSSSSISSKFLAFNI